MIPKMVKIGAMIVEIAVNIDMVANMITMIIEIVMNTKNILIQPYIT
jgi:hypothetical protein